MSAAGLTSKLRRARLRASGAAVERARKLLGIYLDTADQHRVPRDELLRSMADGVPAVRIGGAELEAQAGDPEGIAARAACRAGCAFCCILAGEDGAVISQAEARQLHAALAPLAGAASGRDWHPRACPALDPETRTCRAYAARPMICRSYLSTDAEACEAVSKGLPAEGPGVLSAQSVYLACLAFARALLGRDAVASYGLARVAEGALAEESAETSLAAARHKPRVLEDELKRLSGATPRR
ncbi:YkgJ family cysteine cluster protein [Litorisediminicola beolgyonensis]|uniref:YkgJ family cysteine cluster protein n=1 Tax=Litorisediminicola beolgyonensis TaxID=1173614 RepID=A0ABW3ZIP8_9RHOB